MALHCLITCALGSRTTAMCGCGTVEYDLYLWLANIYPIFVPRYPAKQMKIILTGTTGMIGEGILIECLDNTRIKEILSISRKPTGKQHPKQKEHHISDFLTINLEVKIGRA